MKPLIIIFVLIVVNIIFWRQVAKKHYFVCPNCNNRFKVSLIKIATSTTVFNFDKHKLRCPSCGNKDIMKQIKD